MATKLTDHCKNELGFERPPKLFLKQDKENALNILGKTAQYNPGDESITLFITNRHPKDILRSLAHELIHHHQNLRGDLTSKKIGKMTPTYAQDNEHMRNMEKEAYLMGNILFRDWEDSCKNTFLKESKNMYKLTEEEKRVLKKFSLIKENKVLSENEGAFAPNHYCVHHGGVEHNGAIELAEAVGHNYNKDLGRVTHYDMKLTDGTILEGVAFENIRVTNASLANEHMHAVKDDEDDEIVPEAHCGSASKDDDLLPEGEKMDCEKCKGSGKMNNAECAHCSGTGKANELEEASKEEFAQNRPPYDEATAADRAGDDGKPKNESKIQTPEQENVLYENRFGNRNDELFNKLTNKWSK